MGDFSFAADGVSAGICKARRECQVFCLQDPFVLLERPCCPAGGMRECAHMNADINAISSVIVRRAI